jgi:uncharacterized OsmC-like protein/alpha-beta hydrolase superfamily lysophospholipase
MAREAFEFTGEGGHKLVGRLELPDGPTRATALFAHCFTCGKDIFAATRISRRLSALGIAVLRFDFTGLGHSEGEFGNSGFSGNVADLRAAAAALAARGMAPGLLIGHSLGGAAVLAAARSIASARAVVTLGAPFDPGHVAHHFGAHASKILDDGSAEVQLGGRPFTIARRFLEDLQGATLVDDLPRLKKALLVLHAPGDTVVGIENAAAIFTAAKHPKSFVTLDGADHLISKAEDADYAAEVIATWVTRYLDLPEVPPPPPGVPEGVTRVTEADAKGFLQHITAGKHMLRADEPETYGGTDVAPSPYQLLAASLGACTSMTVRMYARRKGWPLAGISVDVRHDKVHALDCADCTDNDRIDRFSRRIVLRGKLDAEQRARLMEIADKCPVHRTLEAGARIETEEVFEPLVA